MNIEAMFTNDIVGGVTTKKDSKFRDRVRVFAEGVPSSETEREAATRRMTRALREFEIEGELGLSLFPWLAVEMGRASGISVNGEMARLN